LKRHFLYGVEAPELGWVPAPRYLLRRDRVLRHLGEGNGRTVLDIGCGAGALLADLAERNFNCVGLESSTQAAQVARAVNSGKRNVSIVTEPGDNWQKKFDVLLALEVLEHISEDHKALETWLSWLKPGGLVVVSVPSHMRKWSVSDEWAGHVRRYERED